VKALHLTYRFGRDIVGGAEHYMYMLSRNLVGRGIDVDLWTTRTARLPAIARFGVRWDNAVGPGRERVDGIDVSRYATFNLPPPVVRALDRSLAAQWRREEALPTPALLAPGGAYLDAGWYPLETHGPLTMRWTEGCAGLVIRDRDVSEVSFEAMCPRPLEGRFEVDGELRGIFGATEAWKRYRFPTTGGDPITARIVLGATWQPAGDPRRLGIAVRSLSYTAGGRDKAVDLADDRTRLLRRDRPAWVAHLQARAMARPWISEAAFGLLRAPLAPGMLWALERKIETYDVVLAQMTPYSTVNYAVHFGRKHGVPVVLLPHFHLEDDFYHLRHYYRAFGEAATVLAASDVQRAFFEGLGATSTTVGGGGVDPAEFRDSEGAGRAFRQRLGLGDVPLILFVGRKSGPKRYDALVRAVDILNEHVPCRLVMIGPDEDGRPIASSNVVYLGRQERSVVIAAYHAADVFAMMSESESFGIVFLEAWMAGKPVVGSRACAAVADLIADGKDGFLCDDELDCVERIAELILDRRLAAQLGQAGYEKVMTGYTWDAIGGKVATLYATLAGDGRR
jgi:glycosyltransferase involved in cell wall biosynthesis